jgi:hypothetical protein
MLTDPARLASRRRYSLPMRMRFASAVRMVGVGLSAWLALSAETIAAGRVEPPHGPGQPYRYRALLKIPDWLEPFAEEMTPGSDMFPDERVAGELIARLAELSDRLKEGSDRAADLLLAPSFRGGRLRPAETVEIARRPSLQIVRSRVMSKDPTLNARSFAAELRDLLQPFQAITVAEFLITAIDVKRDEGRASTDVRYDIVGPGREAWRVQRVGAWRLFWLRDADG